MLDDLYGQHMSFGEKVGFTLFLVLFAPLVFIFWLLFKFGVLTVEKY